jgi:predicted nucleic acid-binding protein
VIVEDVENRKHLQQLATKVDLGEASAIALCYQKGSVQIILDDYKARRFAEELQLQVIGTMGIIVRAKKEGIIDSVKPVIEKIQATNFRLSSKVIDLTLAGAGE